VQALKREAEAAFLLETMETGDVASVDWLETRVTPSASGGAVLPSTVMRSALIGAWIVRRPRQHLASHAGRISGFTASATAVTAATLYLNSLRLQAIDERAAIATAYVAAEAIVDDLKKTTHRLQWGSAGIAVGLTKDSILQLYDSCQLLRHYRVTRARTSLGAMGLPALTAQQCCERTAEFLQAFLASKGI